MACSIAKREPCSRQRLSSIQNGMMTSLWNSMIPATISRGRKHEAFETDVVTTVPSALQTKVGLGAPGRGTWTQPMKLN